MKQGIIHKNQQGRYALECGYYWTCGDYMELNIDNKWVIGRVEADNKGQYYFTDEKNNIYLHEGMVARVK